MINKSFVRTVKEKCRVCYTCVRECPAKAIRIVDGQAEIIGERCINCGNCVKVCSQGAKQVISTVDQVKALLDSGENISACIAPSFPAEFENIRPKQLVGMLKKLGFSMVNEVAFGADLVADRYRKLMKENDGKRYIATTCPALITFVEKYHPELVGSLSPIVSPMIAVARALRSIHSKDLKIVFIGPCIAKKQEAASRHLPGEIDATITFIELRSMFSDADITPESVEPGDFDPPHAGLGSLFSISRGLLQAANIPENLMAGDIVAADGRENFVDAIKEFESGDLDAGLLEVLCCNGCIMGPGISSGTPQFYRRSQVSRYVREYISKRDHQKWLAEMANFTDLDLTRPYAPNDQRIPVPNKEELKKILEQMGKFSSCDELNCGACGYVTCREHAIAIYKGLAESEMCLPYTIDQLNRTIKELGISNEQLAETQEALMHSEKLASMGQLAAGIAHEVNNPLGVVLMYAHLLKDEYGCDVRLHDDLDLIAEQADRCKKIVAGLLGFARENKVTLEPTDIHELVERSLITVPAPENVKIIIEKELENPIAELDRDQVIQILTNLITNSYAAMPDGGSLTIKTRGDESFINFIVTDTGIGIPKENIGKIFEPFYTTKQLGKGTGLGLSVTYGIVKMHYGDIKVESNTDPAKGQTGTTFTVTLPRKGKET
ncbi:MAG: 4Fe-4S binding protein [Candidatus Latescibacteria bacterium]|nr:4Fe-4S binding protein [Candidatus Latescibacterota bacterium]